MKKHKTLFYLLAIALMAVVFGEWFTMTNFQTMPNQLIVYYLNYGFLFRIITFTALPVLLYNKEESLMNRFYKRDKSAETFTFRQKQWLIFSYIFVTIFALFSINLLSISPLISLSLYIILGVLGVCFSFFTEKQANKKIQIKTDETLIFNQYSINIKGKNIDDSKEKWLNIVNPFRGILGIAANGAGKTVSFVEPCIEQYAFKGYAGILFDFKFPTLSNIAHLHFGRKEVLSWQGKEYELIENPTRFYVINFTDITRSHRINPLNPKYIKNQIYAKEFAEAIINSLQKGQNYNDKFFTPSAITLLTAIIWFLKKHYPQYCTFPHVVNLIVGDSYEILIKKLREDDECAGLIRSIITAIESKAGNQLAGVIASLQMPFGTMNIPEYMYVLSGDDTTIDVNEKENPKVICVGTAPDIAAALSPIISLIFTVALKTMNQQGKHHSFALMDEAAQIFIPNIADIPATARSNKVSFNIVAQDVLQFESIYSKPVSDSLIGNLNYQIYLKIANLETAKRVSATIGKEKEVKRSESVSANTGVKGGSNNEGFNFSEAQTEVILPNQIMQFKVGEMVGICEETKHPTFHLEVERNIFPIPCGTNGSYDKDGRFHTSDRKIPEFNQNIDVQIIAEKIKYECKMILATELPLVTK
nr:type IV secretory system conjugative DNA transfer family protein [uncultured Emticicia sp.]